MPSLLSCEITTLIRILGKFDFLACFVVFLFLFLFNIVDEGVVVKRPLLYVFKHIYRMIHI